MATFFELLNGTSPLRRMPAISRAIQPEPEPVDARPIAPDSTLMKILNPPLSAVARLGEALDTTFGGRSIRGLLAGKPGELLSALPTIAGLALGGPIGLGGAALFNIATGGIGAGGVGDTEDYTTGRDLLQSWTGSDPGFFPGLAADILTDPSTFIGGGLTKAGSVVKAAGLGDDVAKLAGKGAMGARQAAYTTKFKDILGADLTPLQRTNLDFAISKSGRTADELAEMPINAGWSFGLPFSQVGGKGLGAAVPISPPMPKLRFPDIAKVKSGSIGQRLSGLKPEIGMQSFGEALGRSDAVGKWLRSTGPAVRAAKWFNQASGNAETLEVQLANERAYKAAEQDFAEYVGDPVYQAIKKTEGVPDIGTAQGGQTFRHIAEGFEEVELANMEPEELAHYTAMQEAAGDLRAAMDRMLRKKQAVGSPVEEFVPPMYRYFTRRLVPGAADDATYPSKTRFTEQHRRMLFQLIPEGSHGLEAAVRDDDLTKLLNDWYNAGDPTAEHAAMDRAAAYVKTKVQGLVQSKGPGTEADDLTWSLDRKKWLFDWFDGGWKKDARLAGLKGDDLAREKAALEQKFRVELDNLSIADSGSEALADWISRHNKNLFSHPIADALMYLERGNISVHLEEEYIRELAGLAVTGETPKPGWVRVDDALNTLGFRELHRKGLKGPEQSWEWLTDQSAKNFLNEAEAVQKSTGLRPMEQAFNAAKAAGQNPSQDDFNVVMRQLTKKWWIPKATVDDMVKSRKTIIERDVELPFKRFRSATQYWKDIVTLANPRFYARNYTSAAALNAAHLRMADPETRMHDIMRSYRDTNAIIAGKDVDLSDLYPGLDPAAATEKFRQEVFSARLIGAPRMYLDPDALEKLAQENIAPQQYQYEQLLTGIPGKQPTSFREQGKAALGALKDPKTLKLIPETIAGTVQSLRLQPLGETVSGAIEGGRKLNATIENQNRIAGYIFLRRKGVEPVTAKNLVDAAHVNYSKLTQLERKHLKGLVPFYTWPRTMAETVMRSIMERPAGPFTQLARVERLATERDPTLPAYMAGGLAIGPLFENEQGDATYITNLADLPPELFNRMMAFGPGSSSRTFSLLMGNLNPAIKFPIEWGTSRSLYDTRDLRDKEGKIGQALTNVGLLDTPRRISPLAELVASQTPGISQVAQMTSQLSDTRKPFLARLLNIGSGVRFATVSEQQRDYAIRNAIEQQLRGSPGISMYSNLYSGNQDVLTDEQKALMALNAQISTRTRKRKKEQRALEGR